jgi:DNA primase catalytic subunit
MEFTPEERREILDGLALREAREAQAKREEEASRKSEAERLHREELARVAQRKEDERKQRISDNLNQCLKLLQQAIASFEQGDEGGFYRQIVKYQPTINLTMQWLSLPPEPTTSAEAGIPTVKIKAANPLGYALINSVDFIEGVHKLYEEDAQ